MKIFLIGFMGSGKTTIGRMLAAKLGYEFIDLDKWIEAGEGRTIPEIFADPQRDGQAYFRELEHKYLQDVMVRWNDAVISTGGGTPCFNNNMELMNADGVTIYLKLTPAMLADRLKTAKTPRPLIAGKTEQELLDYITCTLTEREPYYGRANVVVSNLNKDVDRLLEIIQPYFTHWK